MTANGPFRRLPRLQPRRVSDARYAENRVGAVVRAAQAADVACETVQVEHERPYRAVIDITEAKRCDLINIASHGRHGVSAIVLGSETVKVLTHCKVPMFVNR